MFDEPDRFRDTSTYDQAWFGEKRKEFCRYFRDLWSEGKPLAKLFQTENNGYLYDTGTNKVFACHELEFYLLNALIKMEIDDAIGQAASRYSATELIQAFEGIRTVINAKNILKTKKEIRFSGAHFDNLREQVLTGLGMIQLEVTERCNLRCTYCIYGAHYTEKRNHGTSNMSKETAFRAIDHLKRSSGSKKDVAVTFYGGEPLLCLPLIRACVRYARSLFAKSSLSFSLTTNATLIGPAIAKYLSEEEFNVHVSIDGPQDIHDEYRKDIYGEGSYLMAISGLKALYDAYKDNDSKLSLSIVYAPPYSQERIDRIAELWDENPWLSRKTALTITYPVGFPPPTATTKNSTGRESTLFEWASKGYVAAIENGSSPHPLITGIVEKELARLVKRAVYSKPPEAYCLNACCVPGARKQFVSVDGNITVCERIGMAPAIGNVESGVDIELIRKLYISDYVKESLRSCSECWAIQLCPICYMDAFSKNNIDIQKKDDSCAGARYSVLKYLTLFCRLLEINESGLDHLKEFELK